MLEQHSDFQEQQRRGLAPARRGMFRDLHSQAAPWPAGSSSSLSLSSQARLLPQGVYIYIVYLGELRGREVGPTTFDGRIDSRELLIIAKAMGRLSQGLREVS